MSRRTRPRSWKVRSSSRLSSAIPADRVTTSLPQFTARWQRALEIGDADNASVLIGQDAGLIHDIAPAGEIVERIVAEAEALLKDRLPKPVRVG